MTATTTTVRRTKTQSADKYFADVSIAIKNNILYLSSLVSYRNIISIFSLFLVYSAHKHIHIACYVILCLTYRPIAVCIFSIYTFYDDIFTRNYTSYYKITKRNEKREINMYYTGTSSNSFCFMINFYYCSSAALSLALASLSK